MHETFKKEKALLVMVEEHEETPMRDVLAAEFKNLVEAAGIEVVETFFIKHKKTSPRFFITPGKAQELADLQSERLSDAVIFNIDLKPGQQRNIEDLIQTKLITRTQLITDIFAKRAHTQEGILQVELAQLEYLLPRLKGKGIMLSRLGGGIGTRGPGEKKLEIDRRHIEERVCQLKKEIETVRVNRTVMRKKREKEGVKVCSLVGYTSAGKTSLFNALTSSGELVHGGLFTTLDTVSRAFNIHDIKIVISDTVGFLYKLPPRLVEAFKATLEELHYADVLLHIVDSSAMDIKRLKTSVDGVLDDLKLQDKPVILVFNKIDKLDDASLRELKFDYPHAVFISALKNTNIESLKEVIYKNIFAKMPEAVITIPFSAMDLLDYIHNNCEVIEKTYNEKNVTYRVRAYEDKLEYLHKKGLEVKIERN